MGSRTASNYAPLGELLEEARDTKELTKRQAAEKLGVSAGTYYGWLRGQQVSSPELIDAIVDFTGKERLTVLEVTGWLGRDGEGEQ